MKMPLISVIIPIFNLEKYISTCIYSILNQTYPKIEIILINDGSTDNSARICNEIATKYNNIKVLHQQNTGVSSARNLGIDSALGDYIMFVDGDDAIREDCITLLYNDMVYYDADITTGERQNVNDYNIIINKTYDKSVSKQQVHIFNSTDAIKLLLKWQISSSSCTRLYKKTCINNIRFIVGKRYNEDRYFLFESILNAELLTFRKDPIYIVYTRRDSASGKKGFYTTDVIYFSEKILFRIAKEAPELYNIAQENDLLTKLQNIHSIFRKNIQNKCKKELFNNARQHVINYNINIWNNLPLKYRLEKCILHTNCRLIFSFFIRLIDFFKFLKGLFL